ncbi:MAG TPA: SBBP repeat-containing protein, partial [Polyangiaceae bacterium]|nr:SBBP repeat-containing protein [Polyangiaceae bacterium]
MVALLASVGALVGILSLSPDAPSVSRPNRAQVGAGSADSRAAAPLGGSAKAPPSQERVREQMLALPLRFERNEGQFDHEVRYLARAEGLTLTLGDHGPTMYLQTDLASAADQSDEDEEEEPGRPRGLREARPANSEVRAVKMRIANAAPRPKIVAGDELETKTNYYLGNDKSKWRSNVANYGRVTYRNVLPGIDVVYHGDGRKFEYDFVVNPGASPDVIAIDFEGADEIERNQAGELEIAVADRTLVQHKPVIYQDIDGARRPVDGAFRVLDDTRIGFEVAEYDRARPLVIDPTVVFATYLGGSGVTDTVTRIAFTSTDQIAMVGQTNSTNFPTASAYDTSANGSTDGYVAVLNSAGTALVFSTYIGGSSTDIPYGVAVDGSDAVFGVGYTTSNNFPTQAALDSSFNGGNDAFLFKFTSAGALVFSTYLGGSSFDYGGAVATDSLGNAYAVGLTTSSDFPTTVGAFDTSQNGASYYDGFVTKVSGDGSTILYSTYFGGASDEFAESVAVDSSGNAVIVGVTASTDFPTQSPYQAANAGGYDAFVTKLNAAGNALLFSTYLGGSSSEVSSAFSQYDVALDSSENIYLTGATSSTNFPTASAYQSSSAGGNDAFLSKFSSAGALVYSTYLGGTSSDLARGVAVDGSGRAYVVGQSSSSNFPLVNATRSTLAASEAFLTVFSSTGASLVYSTFFGGTGTDQFYSV